ncbi:MAG TPA: endonuclease III [Paludibacteraceae bacterium]|nr:endonuclease III [Paludibacteraceae bacterium]HOU68609.1 endonuclease III [Paludibacteraceae bacterium]HQF50428.1 endonuclease III [Paludibacteraceae bacterium]
MTKKERYEKAIAWFQKNMEMAETELEFSSVFQLLVAVILSAQCTDKRVNMVTPALFARFPDSKSMSKGSVEEILNLVHSVSYPNSKAKHLHDMAVMLENEFGGEVPSDMDQLQRLPGVGRKTANVMMAVAFNQAAMPVDTHVFRVSNRIGFTNNSKTPLQTERELVRNIPENLQSKAHHWILLHGRYVCTARNPKCAQCGISEICKHYQSNKKKQKEKDNC